MAMGERKVFSAEDEKPVQHAIRESIAHFSAAAAAEAKRKNRTLSARHPDPGHDNRDRPGSWVWTVGAMATRQPS